MKKISIVLIFMSLFIVGCQSNVNEDIDLTELPYYSYLNDDNPIVTIKISNYGEIKLQLFPDVAENTVNNFIKYIEDGEYSKSTFHRVIEDFMIQGGIVDNPRCSIEGEFSSNGISNRLSHKRGVISMARTSVNDSATSQFFIVHEDSTYLNGNYAAFGGMISGFYVLDEVAQVATDAYDAPLKDIVIRSITVDLNGYDPDTVDCA